MRRLAQLYVAPRPAAWLAATSVLVLAQATLLCAFALDGGGYLPAFESVSPATLRVVVFAVVGGVHAASALLLAPLRTAPQRRGRGALVALAAGAGAHAVVQVCSLAAACACWARGTAWLAAVATVCAAGAGALRECARAQDAYEAAAAVARVVFLPGVCAAGALHGTSLVRRCDRTGVTTDDIVDAYAALDAADCAQAAASSAAAAAEAARARAAVVSAQAAAVAAKVPASELAALDGEARDAAARSLGLAAAAATHADGAATARSRISGGASLPQTGRSSWGAAAAAAGAAGIATARLSLPATVRAPLGRSNSALRGFGAPLREREAAMVARARAAGAATALRSTASSYASGRRGGEGALASDLARAAAFEQLQWGPVRGLGGDISTLGDTLTSATAAAGTARSTTTSRAAARPASATASMRSKWAADSGAAHTERPVAPPSTFRGGSATQRSAQQRSARAAYRDLRADELVAEAEAHDAAEREAAGVARSGALHSLYWVAGTAWWVAVVLWLGVHAGVVAAFVLFDAGGAAAQAWAVPAALFAFAGLATAGAVRDGATRALRALQACRRESVGGASVGAVTARANRARIAPAPDARALADAGATVVDVGACGDAPATSAASSRSTAPSEGAAWRRFFLSKLVPTLAAPRGGECGDAVDPAAAAQSSASSVTARSDASRRSGGTRRGSAAAVVALREVVDALRRRGTPPPQTGGEPATDVTSSAHSEARTNGPLPPLGYVCSRSTEENAGNRCVVIVDGGTSTTSRSGAAGRRASCVLPPSPVPLLRSASLSACTALERTVPAAPPTATIVVPLRRVSSEAPASLRLLAAAGGSAAAAPRGVAVGASFRLLRRTLSALTEEDGAEDNTARGTVSTAGSVRTTSSASPTMRVGTARRGAADGRDVTAAPVETGAFTIVAVPRPASGARGMIAVDARAGGAGSAASKPPSRLAWSSHEGAGAPPDAYPAPPASTRPPVTNASSRSMRDLLLPPQRGSLLAVGPAPSERVAPRTMSECNVLAAALARAPPLPAPTTATATTTSSSRRLLRIGDGASASPRRASAGDVVASGGRAETDARVGGDTAVVDGAHAPRQRSGSGTLPPAATAAAATSGSSVAAGSCVPLDRGDEFRFHAARGPAVVPADGRLAPELQRRIARVELPDVPRGDSALRDFHRALPPRRFGSSRALVAAGAAAVT